MAAQIAILGLGACGAGWAARLCLMGHDLALFDTDSGASGRVEAAVSRAKIALPGLYDAPLPAMGRLHWHETISQTVERADWIIEALPARLDLKRKALQTVQSHCPVEAVITSAGGFPLEEIQACASRPEQVMGAEASDKSALIPFVELAANGRNTASAIAKMTALLEGAGFVVQRSQGLQARFMAALNAEIKTALSEGHDQSEIAAVLSQAIGPALAGRADDAALIAMLRARRSSYRADTGPLRKFEAKAAQSDDLLSGPVNTLNMAVPMDWTDYNGHMTEAKYLEAFGFATDRFMALVGVDAAYIAKNNSFFTAETHIRHLDEAHIGAPLSITTLCLIGEGKKMSLWHELRSEGRLLATAENMMIHVSLETRRAIAPLDPVARRIEAVAAAHAKLPRPKGMGRAIGQR
ncbi:MAG: thioesterase family protein [Paracoccaceae bacterium]